MSKKYYKGFNKDLQCIPDGKVFQYEVGKTYEEDHVHLCHSGFHACEAPLDVFNYYAPGSGSRYCEVALDGVSNERRDDTKVSAKKITIGAEIGIPGLVKAHIEWVKSNCTHAIERGDAEAATAGDLGAATAGDLGAATAGDLGAATAGYRGAATAGYRGAATAGDLGAATAGYRGAATAGNRGAATAGNRGAATAGNLGAATSRGSSSVGENGIAAARTTLPKVKGGIGSVLVLVRENDDNYDIRSWKAFRIDGKRYKPDTWYTLDEDGKVVKCEEAE